MKIIMGKFMKEQSSPQKAVTKKSQSTIDKKCLFIFSTVSKEELAKRRIPVYPYLL